MHSAVGDVVVMRTPDAGVLLRHWGSTYVVYNIASGDTHQLGVLAGCIIEHLKTRPMTRAELLEQLGPDESVNNTQFCQMLESTLTDLKNMDLIKVHPD